MRRRRRHPSPTEQLQLFALPGSRTPAPAAPRRRGVRRALRVPLTIAAIGLATAGMVGGSFAAWTTQTSNPANQVEAGTLSIANSKASYVFAATDVVPGQSGSDTVTITNDGTIPVEVDLSQTAVTATGIESSLRLRIHDSTSNRCIYPVQAAGACPGTGGPDNDGFGGWTMGSTIAVPAVGGGAAWPAGQAHDFTVSWKLAASSPNSDQGKTGSFTFVWDGTS